MSIKKLTAVILLFIMAAGSIPAYAEALVTAWEDMALYQDGKFPEGAFLMEESGDAEGFKRRIAEALRNFETEVDVSQYKIYYKAAGGYVQDVINNNPEFFY